MFRGEIAPHGYASIRSVILPAGILLVLFLTAGFTHSARAQIRSLALDLKNDLSFHRVSHPLSTSRSRSHGQNYALSLDGYGLDPRLMTLSFHTSFSSSSSSNLYLRMQQNAKIRNLGFYNFSATLFPKNGHPLTFFASRSEQMNQTEYQGPDAPPAGQISVEEHDRWGLQWNIRKNTYYPNIDLNFERSSRERLQPVNTVGKQVSHAFGVRLSNSSQNGKTQYSLGFQGLRARNVLFGSSPRSDEIFLNAGSRLNGQIPVSLNGRYQIRPNSSDRNIEMSARFNTWGSGKSSLTYRNTQYRFSGVHTSIINTNSVLLQSEYPVASNVRVNGGLDYLQSVLHNVAGQRQMDRIRANVQTFYDGKIPLALFDATLGTAIGLEKNPGGNRELTHQSHLAVGARSRTLKGVEVSVRNSTRLSRTYSLGSYLQNTAMIIAKTAVIPRSRL
ncbi:MAG TPA: hypothetical protein VLA34_06895, partial [Candidatus Krumholzibacterium sp.]|nr:hypothetical protein [Candidatus Krumholzibacterium sp.]